MGTLQRVLIAALLIAPSYAFVDGGDLIEKLRSGLSAFYRTVSPVKLHLFFNQPAYVPGDTAYFKVHLVRAEQMLPLTSKNIINIKLYDKSGRQALRTRFVVLNGIGHNQLILPKEIEPGNYLLVAYSDAMAETTTEALFYRQEFIVSGKNLFTLIAQNLAVFVEGGNFVVGASNTVVVSGLQPNDSARLVEGNGRSAISFRSDASGFGRFKLVPEEGKIYSVHYRGNHISMPEAKAGGVALTVSKNESNDLVVDLYTPSEKLRSVELYLTLTVHDKMCESVRVSFEDTGIVSVPIKRRECSAGIGQLTLFDSQGNALAERLVFFPPKPLSAKILISKPEFKVREQVDLTIALSDLDGKPLQSNAALTVYKRELFNEIPSASSAFDNLHLQSDITEWNNLISHLPVSDETIDTYLITRKWQRYDWTRILNNPESSIGSTKPYFFKGKAFGEGGEVVPDSTHITFWLNQNEIVYGLYTRSNGELQFPLFMDLADDNILYAATYKKRIIKNVSIEMYDRELSVDLIQRPYGPKEDPYTHFSNISASIRESYSHYTAKRNSDPLKPAEVRDDLIESDFSVDVKKYKAFSSMTEILREVVPMVRNKKVQGKDDIRIFLKESARFASGSPLYVIDGIITDDTDYFLSLDPSAVLTLGILYSASELKQFGVLGENGIITAQTTISDHSKIIVSQKNVLTVKGINPALPYSSPNHSSDSNPRIPDLRSTLYWNPSVNTNALGTAKAGFYTSDDTGEYVIRLEGITNDGRPFTVDRTFTVTF